jgi:replicative superfamily II helicase
MTMEVGYLSRFGISEKVLPSWRESGYRQLLPLQVKAIEEGKLLGEENLIISAPASSGKTFCAEIAAIAAISRLKKAVLLVPLKAMAEEKHLDFKNKYEPLGLQIVISTADRSEFDERITSGQFDLAIIIYEKFNRFLVKNINLLESLDLVIIDELQMLADEKRGEVLSLILAKISAGANPPRLLGLVPPGGDWEEVASILGARVLRERNRPVDLLRGVLDSGEFRYRRFNDLSEASELLFSLQEVREEEVSYPHLNGFFAAAEKFTQAGEQVLVFLKSKADTIVCARALAERLKLPPATKSLERQQDLEKTTLLQSLVTCLEAGCAFHNADLNLEERFLVENGFRSGDIRLLCSTTTLAMGVNLPAKNVFLETQKYFYSPDCDRSVLVPISRGEFENMSGRAGRLGAEAEFGRSLVIAPNKLQSELLWDKYIRGSSGELPPKKRRLSLPEVILDLVISGSARDFPALQRHLGKIGQLCGGEEVSTAQIENSLSRLLELGVLRTTSFRFSGTKLGEAFAASGLKLDTGGAILGLLQIQESFTLADWVFHLCQTPDGDDNYLPVRDFEKRRGHFRGAIEGELLSPQLSGLISGETVGNTREIRHLKVALVLSDWTSQMATIEIEKKYQVLSGTIRRLAERTSWLLKGVAFLGEAKAMEECHLRRIEEFSTSLLFGISSPGFELATLRLPGMGRDFLWRLKESGITDLLSVLEVDLEFLKKLLPERLALSLKQAAEESKEGKRRPKISPFLFARTPLSSKREELNREGSKNFQETKDPLAGITRLTIEGKAVKNRFLVEVNGKSLLLTHKLYSYLLKLVVALYKREGGWINKFDLETGDNQSRYLWRLKKALEPHCPKGSLIIDNNRMGGYRLNSDFENILISEELLS